MLLGDSPSDTTARCTAAAGAAARRSLTAPVDWPALATDVAAKIGEMFDIPLIGLMLGAWRDFREIKDAADPSRHPPGELVTVRLADHALEASFAPYLDIDVSGLPAVRVSFEISAEIALEGIELTIENAAVRSLRIRACRASARVSCAGSVVFTRGLRELKTPAEILLGASGR